MPASSFVASTPYFNSGGLLVYLVTRLRSVWPDVVLHFRGDCAFGVPVMYDVCEFPFTVTGNYKKRAAGPGQIWGPFRWE